MSNALPLSLGCLCWIMAYNFCNLPRPNKGMKDWRKLSRFLVLDWLKRAKTPYDKVLCEQRLQFRCVSWHVKSSLY